ncbi:DUF6264 family protein [Streptomyces sp. AC495_CC817]|uniref:DUF6264 family protein n=1 Tax=Streptomyces sp. AC495_CC817 TaxID=2823900 RepID=UPI001C25B5E5|nr:DUF6264 family protein [Streptomyces sp. AC495_CC817]
MTDQRPQYGEIATPEEQRRAAGLPPLAEVPPVQGASVPEAAGPAPARSSSVDRFATIALLAYGLINVVTSVRAYLDFGTVMNEAMKILGIEGEFTNFAQGRVWGTVAAVVLVVGWSVTTVISLRRLRAGRRSWWIPLVGAACTMAIVSICIAVPMMGDPAFSAYLAGTGAP